jgi:hypothetical protein
MTMMFVVSQCVLVYLRVAGLLKVGMRLVLPASFQDGSNLALYPNNMELSTPDA